MAHNLSRASTIAVVSVAGTALSIAGFVAAGTWEDRDSRRGFALQSENRASVIRHEVESNLSALNAVRGFIEMTTGPLADDRFQGFAARILESHPSLKAVEWVQRVTDAQRPAFEAQLRREGAPQPFISEMPPGSGKRAGSRAEYYPVRFLYPVNSKNRTAIGFDFGNCKGCNSVLKAAESADAPAATIKFRILEHTGDGYAVGIMLPVRDRSHPAKPILGYAMVLLQVADVVERAIRHFDVQGINIQIFDQDAAPGSRLLHFHSSESGAHPLAENAYRRPDGFEYLSHLKMAGRDWLVICTPTQDYISHGRTFRPFVVLGGGLFVTFAIVTFFLVDVVHLSRLQDTNHLLNEQIQVRLKTEGELAAARDQAVAASRMKSQFLATVSHEIRTPMNGVIGMTQLLLDTPLSADQREYANSVRNSAEALLTVINDILDLSRIEAGRIAVECSAFDLRRTIVEVIQVLAPKAREKGVVLRTAIPECLPTDFLGDRGRVRQVILNLVGNAVKFTPSGEVAVLVECMAACQAADLMGSRPAAGSSCHSGPDKMTLRISVRDTGIGIADDKLALLFEKFSQVDSSDCRRFGGTGLGLAISKELVELLGGTIGVQSIPEQGSVFWFTLSLPIALTVGPADRVEPPAALAEAIVEPNLRVLVAEDNPINMRVATVMLERLGIRADVARNGSEAVKRFQAERYDVILMDCQMPEMDGYAATREIRQCQDPDRPVLIVAMTADAMEGSRERCLAAGMDDYIAKPVNRSTLIQAIGKARRNTASSAL